MIQNKRQYGITKNWILKFEASLKTLEANQHTLHKIAYQAQRDSIESQLETLREEVQAFEALQHSNEELLPSELEALPQRLVRARIAAGLTQAALAKRLGLKEQQIQRYETNQYASASLSRVIEIARAIRAA
jgi:DNA-binding XRE family transcriptional regulator